MSSRIIQLIISSALVVFGIIYMFCPNSFFRVQSKILEKITPKWWFDIYKKSDNEEGYKNKKIVGVIVIIIGILFILMDLM